MLLDEFDYELPEELIAQTPLVDRSASRLLVLERETGRITHRMFVGIDSYLEKGDALVINDTKVIPARLLGKKEGGGAVAEVLLLHRRNANVWEALVRPGKRLRTGEIGRASCRERV